MEKNYDKAVDFHKKSIEKAPFEISFYQNLSIALRKQDKNIDALSMLYFAKILSLNNKSIDFEIAKLNTLTKNYKAANFIFSDLIKDKNLTEEIIHHYCMNLIDWKKESQVITFLKNIDNNKSLYSAIIFTDGVATEGVNPIRSFDEIDIPVHVVGIGSNNEMVDISIQTILINNHITKFWVSINV